MPTEIRCFKIITPDICSNNIKDVENKQMLTFGKLDFTHVNNTNEKDDNKLKEEEIIKSKEDEMLNQKLNFIDEDIKINAQKINCNKAVIKTSFNKDGEITSCVIKEINLSNIEECQNSDFKSQKAVIDECLNSSSKFESCKNSFDTSKIQNDIICRNSCSFNVIDNNETQNDNKSKLVNDVIKEEQICFIELKKEKNKMLN